MEGTKNKDKYNWGIKIDDKKIIETKIWRKIETLTKIDQNITETKSKFYEKDVRN